LFKEVQISLVILVTFRCDAAVSLVRSHPGGSRAHGEVVSHLISLRSKE
jgi:hypothetical protein